MSSSHEIAALAALELLQIKHQQPSHVECRAASELLHSIYESTSTRHGRLAIPPHHHAASASMPLLPSGRNGHGASKSNNASSFNNRVVQHASTITGLPMPVADVNDERLLSPLQCYVRKYCVEFFAVEANSSSYGRQTAVNEGRVGVRCVFCKHLPREEQVAAASKNLF